MFKKSIDVLLYCFHWCEFCGSFENVPQHRMAVFLLPRLHDSCTSRRMISLSRQFIALSLCSIGLLLISGCASTGSVSSYGDAYALNRDAAAAIGSSQPNSVVTVEFDEPQQTLSGHVSQNYFAASGKICRKFQSSQGGALSYVVCQDDRNVWYMQRALPLNSSSLPVGNDTSAIVLSTVPDYSSSALARESAEQHLSQVREQIVVAQPEYTSNVAPDFVQYELIAGENLSSFARRTTGNTGYWPEIAKLNNISDPDKVNWGVLLKVPTDLVSAE